MSRLYTEKQKVRHTESERRERERMILSDKDRVFQIYCTMGDKETETERKRQVLVLLSEYKRIIFTFMQIFVFVSVCKIYNRVFE